MTAGFVYIAAFSVALALGAGAYGYRNGKAACEAEHKARLLEEIETGQRLEQERQRIALERDQLHRQLEEEAHADPVIVERCLSPDRVRRLNALR